MDSCANATAMGRVVCPKPLRVGPSNFTGSAAPTTRFQTSNDVAAYDSKVAADSVDLNAMLRKYGFEAEHGANMPSSPPFFYGSPPCRAPNPLVQDAHFRVGKVTMVSPSHCLASSPTPPSRIKLGNKRAVVRVEGFNCQSPRAVAMAYCS